MTKLKRIVLIPAIALVFLFGSCNSKETIKTEARTETSSMETSRIITDMAGRSVTIPLQIQKVYATHSIGTLFVYTLAPDVVAGWNFTLTDSEKAFIKVQYHDLPVLGRWKGTSSSNTEQLLLEKPDIIINMGDLTDQYIAESDEMQKLLNIPVIMVDGSITHQAASYTFLGTLLHMESRAKILADYSEKVITQIQSNSGTLTEKDKTSVYYGSGMEGLETMPKGSINTEVLTLVGGINVADPGTEKKLGRMQVSMEQLILWNPQAIILSTTSSHNDNLLGTIKTDERWKGIDAVANKRVYAIPYGPYDWFSQPPTLLRIIGMQWLGNLLYPQVFPMDIKQETKDFFKLFFSLDLDDSFIDQLLADAAT